ncbi:hypothetical protein [Elioraea rosea]|nr:hypothetical protein [Elioraea rosea]
MPEDVGGGRPVDEEVTGGAAFAVDTVIAFLADTLRSAPMSAAAR